MFCVRCGAQLGIGGNYCPKCGAAVGATQRAATPTQTRVGLSSFGKVLVGCGVAALLLLIVIFIAAGNVSRALQKSRETSRQTKPSSASAPAVPAPARRVPYEVTRQWAIPNGGYGRVIVIDPKHRTEADMRAIGEILKLDTKNDRNAFIYIFDNPRAAALYERALNLNDQDGRLYDQHFIGTYTRNINTGYHRLDIALKGYATKGPIIQVNY